MALDGIILSTICIESISIKTIIFYNAIRLKLSTMTFETSFDMESLLGYHILLPVQYFSNIKRKQIDSRLVRSLSHRLFGNFRFK